MKSGTGDDPFADEEESEQENGSERQQEPLEQSADLDDTSTQEADRESATVPWRFTRNGVKDGRDAKQIHLQPSTQDREKRFRADVEGEIGEDVLKADLREAALLIAMDHVDEVADQLRTWGYDVD